MPTPNKDPEYLDRLRDYYRDNRRIPSSRRLAELLNFASATAAIKLMARLESAGFVERTPDGDAWIPAPRFFERPRAAGAVRAGTPDVIEGLEVEPYLVDRYLIRQPSKTVLVPVKGDSMSEAGIYDGDTVVVERGREAKKGDFVVARVDGEFTLKELDIEGERFLLRPHNAAYPLIRPQGELEIFGVVTGLLRRYER